MKPGEPTPLDYEVETKDGQTMSFIYTYDSEGENRGFVVDKLEAYIGDEKVGYIKAIYVGSDRVGHFYPSVLNYITQIHGASALPYDNRTLNPAKASPEQLNKAAQNLFAYRYTSEPPEVFADYKSFHKWFTKEAKTNFKLRHATKEFKKFLERTVDKPHVDFICTEKNEHNGVREDNQGRGIGTALYQIMAIELGKRGMSLRSSTLQSPLAKARWESMERKGWASADGDRMVLDPDKFDLDVNPRLPFAM